MAPLAVSEWNGVQYGVPVRSNMLMMFVNKALYEKAGVPVPTPKLTWEEFLEQAAPFRPRARTPKLRGLFCSG